MQAWTHSLWRQDSQLEFEDPVEDNDNPAEETWGDVLGFERSAIIQLAGDVFGAEPRLDILHRVVVWQRREWWQGTASAKGRAEVRGGGRKPWRQKGTGRARASSIRSPLWRGGGVVHGPKPRDHRIQIPNKVHRMALRVALSVKYAQGDLVVVDDFDIPTHRTVPVARMLEDAGLDCPTLFVDGDHPPDNFLLATRNIKDCDAIAQEDISVYSILHRHKLVLTRSAVEHLENRLTTAETAVTPVNIPAEASISMA